MMQSLQTEGVFITLNKLNSKLNREYGRHLEGIYD